MSDRKVGSLLGKRKTSELATVLSGTDGLLAQAKKAKQDAEAKRDQLQAHIRDTVKELTKQFKDIDDEDDQKKAGEDSKLLEQMIVIAKNLHYLDDLQDIKAPVPRKIRGLAFGALGAEEVPPTAEDYPWASSLDVYGFGHLDDSVPLPPGQSVAGASYDAIKNILESLKTDGSLFYRKLSDLPVSGPQKDLINKYWDTDKLFGYYRLCGPNPTLLQNVSELPTKSQFSSSQLDAVLKTINPRASFQDELKKGNVYLEDYAVLEGINAPNQMMVATPINIFWYNGQDLLPLAIQILQKGDVKDNVYYANEDPKYWQFAKTAANTSYFIHHEIYSHLGRTHLIYEVALVANYRTLSETHTLAALIRDHELKTLSLNREARQILVPTLIPLAGLPVTVVQDAASRNWESFTWSDLNWLADLKKRNIDLNKIPTYYYGSDSAALWKALSNYHKQVLEVQYPNDQSLLDDEEAQAWLQEIRDHGRLNGFPKKSEVTVSVLIDIVTSFVFVSTSQHSAVNYIQDVFFSNIRSCPPILNMNIPKKTDITDKTLFNAVYKSRTQIYALYTLVAFLSAEQGATNIVDVFGQYALKYKLDILLKPLPDFQKALEDLTIKISQRNPSDLGFKADVLTPKFVANSICK